MCLIYTLNLISWRRMRSSMLFIYIKCWLNVVSTFLRAPPFPYIRQMLKKMKCLLDKKYGNTFLTLSFFCFFLKHQFVVIIFNVMISRLNMWGELKILLLLMFLYLVYGATYFCQLFLVWQKIHAHLICTWVNVFGVSSFFLCSEKKNRYKKARIHCGNNG